MTVLVGIDVGTTAAKGLAIDPDGERSSPDRRSAYPLSTPRPGWAEQDPEDWWRATKRSLGDLRDAVGPSAGIGLSGQMHGLVALDDARPRAAPGDPVERPADRGPSATRSSTRSGSSGCCR